MDGPAVGQRATRAVGADLVHLLAAAQRVEAGPLVDLGLVHLEVEGAVRGGGQHLERAVGVDEDGRRRRGQRRGDAGQQPGQGTGDVEVGPHHGRVGAGEDLRDARACHVDSIS